MGKIYYDCLRKQIWWMVSSWIIGLYIYPVPHQALSASSVLHVAHQSITSCKHSQVYNVYVFCKFKNYFPGIH